MKKLTYKNLLNHVSSEVSDKDISLISFEELNIMIGLLSNYIDNCIKSKSFNERYQGHCDLLARLQHAPQHEGIDDNSVITICRTNSEGSDNVRYENYDQFMGDGYFTVYSFRMELYNFTDIKIFVDGEAIGINEFCLRFYSYPYDIISEEEKSYIKQHGDFEDSYNMTLVEYVEKYSK